jgi:hypothetical protein
MKIAAKPTERVRGASDSELPLEKPDCTAPVKSVYTPTARAPFHIHVGQLLIWSTHIPFLVNAKTGIPITKLQRNKILLELAFSPFAPEISPHTCTDSEAAKYRTSRTKRNRMYEYAKRVINRVYSQGIIFAGNPELQPIPPLSML